MFADPDMPLERAIKHRIDLIDEEAPIPHYR